ncbi:unnamed protein product, partial [Brenthis ino]
MSSIKSVNEDLAKERRACTFNVKEVTYLFDGEDIALNGGAWADKIPEECLDTKARYENAVRKSCVYANIVKNELIEMNGIESFGSPVLRRTADAFFKDISPFLLHVGMFVPTLFGQCTAEQQAMWLPKALSMQIIGAYVQTELGHGTFIRGLETTATYDPTTEEFVLHSPTLTSYKWWASGLGRTANHCVVVAQLYTQGKCYGTHLFIVQIRDMETHKPLPGIKVGELGPRMGFNTADNGFLAFNQYRIPRNNMLMKNAQVKKDGTYVKTARHGKLTYGTMVLIRVNLVGEASFNLAKAVTIAVRYSAVRRQSELRPDAPEPQILDYPTQQHKLFICIATAHAFQLAASWLWGTFTAVQADMVKGNVDTLPELHALSSCLKAVSTSDAAIYIEQCRYACGGHGYMVSSNLPNLYAYVAATRTYEGDYTVLLLQTARFLVKAWEQAEAGNVMTPTVAYLNRYFNTKEKVLWENTPEGIIRSFQAVAAGKTTLCVKNIRDRMKSGKDYEDAWLLTTVQLVNAAEAHCRAVLLLTYWNEIQRLTETCSENVKTVMNHLVMLYLVYWALERTGDLLRYSSISEQDIDHLQRRYEELLESIRPNAVGLVDAFDVRDELLHSTLGSYDGRVYERIMEEVEKNPVNMESVSPSYHKYIKPMIKGKL